MAIRLETNSKAIALCNWSLKNTLPEWATTTRAWYNRATPFPRQQLAQKRNVYQWRVK